MKKYIFLSLFIIGIAVAITSCTKGDNPTGTVMLHIHSNIDTSEIYLGGTFTDAMGRKIKLTTAQFFLSSIKMRTLEGDWNSFFNATIFKTVDQEEYLVGQMSTGTYTTISFDVGVDNANNHNSPSSFLASSPLSKSTSDVWYGNTSDGYIFMNIAGVADSSANHNGAVNCPIAYCIGTDALRKNVVMPNHPTNFSVDAGKTLLVHIIADYGAVLAGVNFATQPSTTSLINPAVATTIANSIPSMFRYEQ